VGQHITSYLWPFLTEALPTKTHLVKYGLLIQNTPFGTVPFVKKGFIRTVNLII
jgi:hypothetical protein